MKSFSWLFVWSLLVQIKCFRPHTNQNQIQIQSPNMNSYRFDPNHLDKSNLERLEKMFYLKNSRYHPMRNRIVQKFNKNRRTDDNITHILERINEEFLKQYKEQIDADDEEELKLNDYDEVENKRKNGSNKGFFDENGVFRYHQNHMRSFENIIL